MKNNYFVYIPDEENETGNSILPKDEDKKDAISATPKKEELSFIAKIRKALREWSNGDKRDEDFDNTQV